MCLETIRWCQILSQGDWENDGTVKKNESI